MTLIEQLRTYYKGSNIVVDTNLLILLIVGSYNKEQIERFKRTSVFTANDYDKLNDFLRSFKVVVTPNILTEITNLCDGLNSTTDFQFFRHISQIYPSLEEICIGSELVLNETSFYKFGLTDSLLEYLSKRKVLILTDDLRLYGYLNSLKLLAINFNHIRSEYLIK